MRGYETRVSGRNGVFSIQRPVADRIVFQSNKAEFENKTVLWEFKKRGNDANMDSNDSISFVLSIEAVPKLASYTHQ